MDGWAELYYRTENDYKAKENKVLPYSVNCGEHKNIGVLVNILKDAGFSYVVTTTGAPSLMLGSRVWKIGFTLWMNSWMRCLHRMLRPMVIVNS